MYAQPISLSNRAGRGLTEANTRLIFNSCISDPICAGEPRIPGRGNPGVLRRPRFQRWHRGQGAGISVMRCRKPADTLLDSPPDCDGTSVVQPDLGMTGYPRCPAPSGRDGHTARRPSHLHRWSTGIGSAPLRHHWLRLHTAAPVCRSYSASQLCEPGRMSSAILARSIGIGITCLNPAGVERSCAHQSSQRRDETRVPHHPACRGVPPAQGISVCD